MMNPERQLQAKLTKLAMENAPILEQMGLKQGTVGFNRAMFNVMDMAEVDENLVQNFIKELPKAVAAGATIEAIAKARADSFRHPESGQWIYNPEAFDSYSSLYAEQRRRASGFDYKGALG